MKKDLFLDLIRFALAQNTARERLRYVALSLIFYPLLARAMSTETKHADSASGSEAGDDIYPLF